LIKWLTLNQLLSNQPIKDKREDLDVEEEEAVVEDVEAEVVDEEEDHPEERTKNLDNGSQSPSLEDLLLTR
jgi:hypothetical protein